MPRIQHKRGTSANLASVNPTPLAGELVFDSTENAIKIGDGATAWTSLAYVTATPRTHTHSADAITSGTIDYARLPVGSTASTVCAGDDARLTDARAPTAHKSTHATGGSDALTPADIGAAPAASPIFSGNVGIGTSPTSFNSSFNNVVIGNGSSVEGMTIYSSAQGTLAFGDTATTTADGYRGFLAYIHSGDYMVIGTGGAERFRANASGVIVSGVITVSATSGSAGSYVPSVTISGDPNTGFGQVSGQSDSASIFTAGHERVRVDASGRFLVGATSGRNLGGFTPSLIEGTDANGSRLAVVQNTNNTAGAGINLCKSRGTSVGSVTIVQSGDTLGSVFFNGADGTDLSSVGASVSAQVDGTPAANDLPGRLVFSTTASGSQIPTERLRITSAGNVGIQTTSPASTLHVNGVITVAATSGSAGSYAPSLTFSGDQNTGFGQVSGQSDTASVFTAGQERVRVDASGRVGIGTGSSTPAGRLEIRSDVTSGNANVRFTNGLNWGYGVQVEFAQPTSNGAAIAQTGAIINGWDSDDNFSLRFRTMAAGTVAERLRVDSSGKVGIGTASPTAALDINSDTIRLRTAKTPASASDTGNAGDICWDANFVYVCTATNTWRKARLSADGQTFTGTTTFNGPIVEGRVVGGNTGTAKTIALTNGTLQDYTLTGNCTFTMPTATAGQSFTLMLRTGAGSYTATFTGVKWPGSTPVVTTTASRMDLFTFVSDGTNWYGNVVQGYTP